MKRPAPELSKRRLDAAVKALYDLDPTLWDPHGTGDTSRVFRAITAVLIEEEKRRRPARNVMQEFLERRKDVQQYRGG